MTDTDASQYGTTVPFTSRVQVGLPPLTADRPNEKEKEVTQNQQ